MHEIIVGNIGKVYQGDDEGEAQRTFDEYVRQSKTERGRAGGENVTWFKDNEIHKEYFGREAWITIGNTGWLK